MKKEVPTVLEVGVVVDVDQDSKSGDTDADCEDSEGEAMFGIIGQGCHQHGECKCCGPRRNGMELSLNRTVAVAFDDTCWRVSPL